MAVVKMLYIPNIINLTYDSADDLRMENLPMNRFETTVTKNANNTIDFSIRDKDRKPTVLLDKVLTAHISNVETNEVMLTLVLENVDDRKGLVRMKLSKDVINPLPTGYYKYAITVEEDNGREGFVFTDQTYNAVGYFELTDSAIPFAKVPIEVDVFLTFTDKDGEPYYVTGATPSNGKDVHTFTWYLNNFAGELYIQAFDRGYVPVNDSEWKDLYENLSACVSNTGTIVVTINGNYDYFRFKYVPVNEGGKVDKVTYL